MEVNIKSPESVYLRSARHMVNSHKPKAIVVEVAERKDLFSNQWRRLSTHKNIDDAWAAISALRSVPIPQKGKDKGMVRIPYAVISFTGVIAGHKTRCVCHYVQLIEGRKEVAHA